MIYEQQLRSKMHEAQQKGDHKPFAAVRNFVNENIVKNIHSSSNTLFSQDPVHAIKKMIGSADK